jgi:hypothetical protein
MEKFLAAIQDSLFALIPLLIIVFLLQVISLKIPKKDFMKILYSLLLTFVGLTLFLYGTEIGFVTVGHEVGLALGNFEYKWLVIMIGFIIGIVITLAEPAVKILNEQIEEVTLGYINKKLVMAFLAIGVAFSVAFSIIRIYTGISLLYFIIPGYLLVYILSKFTSQLFLAMAIDAGGVVTGPMIVSVLLSVTVAMSETIELSNPLIDGFGLVALVALIPILSIMILGVIYEMKTKGGSKNGKR